MKALFGSLLSPVANFCYTAINAIPMGGVRMGVFALLFILAVWIMRMPPQLPEGEDPSRFSIRDVRYFALFVLVLQAVLYAVF